MTMNVNQGKKATPKRDVQKALDVIEADDKYRYSLHISRSLMADYIRLCKKRRVKSTDEIAAFLQRELKRYDVMT